MASLETNKALAAILTAGIIASGAGVISRIIYHPSMPEENAYVIEVPEGETGGAAAEAEVAPLPVLLAAATPDAGQSEAKACNACHDFEPGGAAKIGPPLWGVVGRDIASVEGFAYSDALLEKDGQWTFDALNAFLENPKGWAPGTKMTYAGIRQPEDRADVLVYLRSLAENPVPLPEAPAQAAEGGAQATAAEGGTQAAAAEGDTQAAAAEGDTRAPAAEGDAQTEPAAEAGSAAPGPAQSGDKQVAAAPSGATEAPQDSAASGAGLGERLAHADLDAGAKSARICSACHIFEEGGGAKVGPPLWDVVGRDIASVEDYTYSEALAGKDGAWSYEALDEYLSAPKDWAPGTKMAFVGVKKPDDRANVILYLRSLSSDPAPLP